ncbi:MAG: hypothetical protein Q9213_004329 [Squamulea squamosa]
MRCKYVEHEQGAMDQTNQKKLYPIKAVLIPSLKAGALSATRVAILRAWEVNATAPAQDRIYPSTLAGGITGGTIGGLARGRANIIPGMIMFSLFGFAGQHIYNAFDARHRESQEPLPIATTQGEDTTKNIHDRRETTHITTAEPLWKRVLNTKWSPMKVLSDEQYEQMLREKLVRVEAELAIVDKEIEKVKQRKGNANQESRDGVK